MELSNFYKDYSVNYKEFETLTEIYTDLMLAVMEYLEQVKNNTAINKVETYRIIPFQRVKVDEACYSLNTLLEDIKVVKKLNLENMTLQEKLNAWNNNVITINQKIDVLNFSNLYIQLAALRNFIQEKDSSIIDFDFFDQNNNRLLRNTDYVLKNNKIFLLKDAANISNNKNFIMTNIAIDYDTPVNLIGKSVNIEYNDKISKNEYTDIVKMLLYAALGGPSIINLRNAIKSISGFAEADLYDKYVRDLKKQERWLNPKYTNFDFVVVFSEEYMADMDRLAMIIDYLKLIKPAYTRFFIILQSIYSDIYNIAIKANDSFNFDTLKELMSEEYITEIIDEDFGKITETIIEEVYKETSSYIRFNDIYRLNIDLRTNQVDNITILEECCDKIIDSVQDIYMQEKLDEDIQCSVTDNNTDIYSADKQDDDTSAVVENVSEEIYNNSNELMSSTTVINVTPHSRLNSTQRLNTDLRTDRITDVVAVYDY